MGYYKESRRTGQKKPLSPAQLQQFQEFQRKGQEKRRLKVGKKIDPSDKVLGAMETGLNVGFGGATLRTGIKQFAGKAPRVAATVAKKLGASAGRKIALGKAAAKYGGAAGYSLLGGLMLSEGVSSLLKRRKERKKEEQRFTAKRWA